MKLIEKVIKSFERNLWKFVLRILNNNYCKFKIFSSLFTDLVVKCTNLLIIVVIVKFLNFNDSQLKFLKEIKFLNSNAE